jgi:hypothetical protein
LDYIIELSNLRWKGVLAGIRRDDVAANRSSWSKIKSDGLPLNVIIWGFDSLSRNMFIRSLPQTYQYLKDKLDVAALEGYNIVGDGTPQALIPILTGTRTNHAHLVFSHVFVQVKQNWSFQKQGNEWAQKQIM